MFSGEAASIWPPARADELVRLWNSGAPTSEIARRLGASRAAIESKLTKLRHAGRQLARRRTPRLCGGRRADRRCLYCGQSFASEHIGNRICPICLVEGPFTSAMV